SPLFQDWLQRHFPSRAQRVMARVREMRAGRDNDPNFGTRMTGQGVWAELLRQRLRKAAARLGMNATRIELDASGFQAPLRAGTAIDAKQGDLFG
ncbi:MAG: radical SAM protein, partial [Gammaproteobacteria bacterium]